MALEFMPRSSSRDRPVGSERSDRLRTMEPFWRTPPSSEGAFLAKKPTRRDRFRVWEAIYVRTALYRSRPLAFWIAERERERGLAEVVHPETDPEKYESAFREGRGFE